MIQISDDGKGLNREDMELTIERYATSKIESAHDLESIGSYGFRGEALASISEVSIFRMQSKQKTSSPPVPLPNVPRSSSLGEGSNQLV